MSLRKQIKVCVHDTCCERGAKEVHACLKHSFGEDSTIDVVASPDCFRFCKQGVNVAVNGNILHGVRPSDATRRVESELKHPTRKIDGLGQRSIDELDDVLDSFL